MSRTAKLTPENKKTAQVTIFITPPQKEALERAAAKIDRAVSWLASKYIIERLRQEGWQV